MIAPDLLALAAETSSEKRRELLRHITDLFFDGKSERNVSEAALFEEIVMRVARDVGRAGRADLAERVADEATAPRAVALALATDSDVAVARPVLSRSTVLRDDDLARIAASAGDDRLEAIAERRILSEVITDVLVRRGSQLVLRTVSGNRGARFSSFGFGELVKRAGDDETLQLNLARRDDLPAEMVADLAPILSDKLKQTLQQMGQAVSPALLDTLRGKLSGAMQERDREAIEIQAIIAEIKDGRSTLGAAVAPLAKADRAFDIASLMAEFSGLDHATAMKALTGTNEEPLIVLFRSLDVSWESFECILQMRAKRHRKSYTKSATTQRTYQQMDQPTAQRVLRFLQVRRASESRAA